MSSRLSETSREAEWRGGATVFYLRCRTEFVEVKIHARIERMISA
jgi:hypothetical protein